MAAETEVNLYTPAEATEVVNSLISPVQNGLKDRYFSEVKVSDSEIITFDIDISKRHLAPYVHPRVKAKIRNLSGYRTDTFKPPYIKQATQITPDDTFTRQIGEPIGGGMSPSERFDAIQTRELGKHNEYLDRRLESQAVEAMRDGTVTCKGEDYPEVVVNFGRPAALSVGANTLSGAARWSQKATANPLKDMRAWNGKSVKEGGGVHTDYIFDSVTYDYFQDISSVDDKLDRVKIDLGKLDLTKRQAEGLLLRGTIEGSLIFTYDMWYIDPETGTETAAFTGGYVMGVGASMMGVRHYGAIKDLKARMKGMPIFAKMFEEEDPSGITVLTQSAPLLVPRRIVSTFCAKVHSES